jgi:hypothetical protein
MMMMMMLLLLLLLLLLPYVLPIMLLLPVPCQATKRSPRRDKVVCGSLGRLLVRHRQRRCCHRGAPPWVSRVSSLRSQLKTKCPFQLNAPPHPIGGESCVPPFSVTCVAVDTVDNDPTKG